MSTKKKTELPKKEKSNLQRKGPPPMPARGMAVSFLLMAIFLTSMYLFSDSSKNSGQLDYSDFVKLVKSGRVSKVDIAHDGQEITTLWVNPRMLMRLDLRDSELKLF